MREAVYILGDVHLRGTDDEVERLRQASLVAFFRSLPGRTRVLFLMGDLFDFWFEFYTGTPSGYDRVLAALGELTRSGVRVVFLPGNHDAWPGRALRKHGLRIVGPELCVELFGLRVLLAHGDGWARSDGGYRLLRAFVRIPAAVELFKFWPARLGTGLARWVSSLSRDYAPDRDKRLRSEYRAAVRRRLRDGFDLVVIGHTHEAACVSFPEGAYLNPGLWYPVLSYGVITADGPALRTFNWRR
jgi:UDP-2,3-diacylglucosamine hydrolase